MEDIATAATNEFFQYFSDENNNSNDFFDVIDFHDLFDDVGEEGANVLPELEAVDHELPSEFSSSGGYRLERNGVFDGKKLEEDKEANFGEKKNKEDRVDVVRDKDINGKLRRKSTRLGQTKNPNGKRKQKVDWTPELHKRFVQAVEQLGLDRAVPSKILELMKIDCLTRHNIASHLQKYRLQRKHMLAREAESAAWNRKRQIYGSEGGKREPPTMGFPPPSPTSTYHHHHPRPFHVWGHPNPNHQTFYPWPRVRHPVQPLPPSLPPPPPPLPWATTIPCLNPQLSLPPNHLYWFPYHQQRFNVPPPVQGIPSHITKTVEIEPDSITRSDSPPPFDFNDSLDEDETIGDIFLKPRLPLPLGLKPPSLDGVLEELQRQGISTIPPVDP